MIRFVFQYCVIFAALATPAAAQTALSDRPGMWISVPQSQAPVVAAPETRGVVLEAPSAGPLITGTSAPRVLLTPPEPALVTAPPSAPDTRPVPRPSDLIAVGAVEAPAPEATEVAVVALEPVAVAELPAPVEAVAPAPVGTVAVAPAAVDPEPVAPTTIEVAAALPVPSPVAPSARPVPRPETAATVALAEALAAQIAAEAHAIMVAAPRELPRADGVAPSEVLALNLDQGEASPQQPVQPSAVPAPAARTPAPVRELTPPSVEPMVAMAFARTVRAQEPAAMSAVLLPAPAPLSRPVAQPVAFVMPPLERAPILPRLHPSGPAALEAVPHFAAVRTAPLSAVLLPSVAARSAPVPRLARAPAPAHDLFPMSALPPSELPPGPASLTRTIQPPFPFAEANAAVLTGQPTIIPVRMPVLLPSTTPAFDTPVTDPDAAVELPAPDAGAIARMMDDAMICWRMANLGPEAQWARLSVDVALDETNMPSAQSIRLTGFARVVSGAAEDAYRAAHAALMGCAEATAYEPVTASTTLVFDRSGVRLQ
ncbi:hypothetical protein [Gymnodinialimonas sp.]